MVPAVGIYALTAAVSAILCVLVLRARDRLGIVDVPNDRSSHTVPKPRTGGIAILVSMVCGLALWAWLVGRPADAWRDDIVLAAGGLAFFALGFADDVRSLPASLRILAQLGIGVAAASFGPRLEVLELPALGRFELLPAAAVALTAVWYVGFVNAFNFMDGVDGIAAGEAIVVGLLVAVLGDPAWGLLVSAAALGFWFLNRQPSRLFLGDGGSYLLGWLLAAMTVAQSGGGRRIPFAVYLLLLGTFIADTFVTLGRRILRRERWWEAHRSHAYQRLAQLGLSHARVAGINAALTALLGLAGILYAGSHGEVQAAILLGAASLFGVLFACVDRMERREPIANVHDLAVLGDLVVVAGAFLFAYSLRFEFAVEPVFFPKLLKSLPYVAAVYLLVGRAFGLHRGVYRYSSFADLRSIIGAVAVAGAAAAALVMFAFQGIFPRSLLVLHPLLAFLGICGVRFGIRAIGQLHAPRPPPGTARRALLLGAGGLAEGLLRHMRTTSSPRYEVVGIVDDDSSKWGLRLHGHPILGGVEALPDVLGRHPVDEIVIAVASRRGEVVRRVIESLRASPARPGLKIASSLDEALRAPGEGLAVRHVKPADLLNREVVRLDEKRIEAALRGARVLITGAGGTIGWELGRQALRYAPASLVLMDNHATSLFQVESELREDPRGVEIVAVLGDVRAEAMVERVFREHRPQLVLHAAAHKHVPQLEKNVPDGITNNLVGTWRLASAAHQYGAETFLLISTDKAVRPASVMGATKRVAELAVQRFSRLSRTRFIAVRFGNVIGSSGSVLTIFEEQLARGRPLTITDPGATRYFITVEEAVGLVLQAVSMAKGGEIFVLKMGAPVRIADMAQNLLLLSGREPGKDVAIRVTGLRPGEKLDEELVEDGSVAVASDHPDVMVIRDQNGVPDDLDRRVKELEELARGADVTAMLGKLAELAPTLRPRAAERARIQMSPEVPG